MGNMAEGELPLSGRQKRRAAKQLLYSSSTHVPTNALKRRRISAKSHYQPRIKGGTGWKGQFFGLASSQPQRRKQPRRITYRDPATGRLSRRWRVASLEKPPDDPRGSNNFLSRVRKDPEDSSG